MHNCMNRIYAYQCQYIGKMLERGREIVNTRGSHFNIDKFIQLAEQILNIELHI